MSIVSEMQRFKHPTLPDVTVYAWEDIRSNVPQEILVHVAPSGKVPVHTHAVDAKMVIVGGEADVLFDQDQLDHDGQEIGRKTVRRGDIVDFRSGMTHGFRAHDNGLTFISINGGIVDPDSNEWNMDNLAPAK